MNNLRTELVRTSHSLYRTRVGYRTTSRENIRALIHALCAWASKSDINEDGLPPLPRSRKKPLSIKNDQ
jgi:hypothetical protein